MRKPLVFIGFACIPLWADTIPTFNATVLNADIIPDVVSYSGSGDSFNFSGFNHTSKNSTYPLGLPIDVQHAGFFAGTSMPGPLFPTTGNVTLNGQSMYVSYYGAGGPIVPVDPANYVINNYPGTYSFAATVSGSLVACLYSQRSLCASYDGSLPPNSPVVAYINVNLSGIETLTVTPFGNQANSQITQYDIRFSSTPVPEPGSIAFVMFGGITALACLVNKRRFFLPSTTSNGR